MRNHQDGGVSSRRITLLSISENGGFRDIPAMAELLEKPVLGRVVHADGCPTACPVHACRLELEPETIVLASIRLSSLSRGRQRGADLQRKVS